MGTPVNTRRPPFGQAVGLSSRRAFNQTAVRQSEPGASPTQPIYIYLANGHLDAATLNLRRQKQARPRADGLLPPYNVIPALQRDAAERMDVILATSALRRGDDRTRRADGDRDRELSQAPISDLVTDELIGSLLPLIPFLFVSLFGISVTAATIMAVPLCAAVLLGEGRL